MGKPINILLFLLMIVGILLFLLMTEGCAPAKFVPRKSVEVRFEPTPRYVVDLSTIPKPDKIKPIFVDKEFQEVNVGQAAFVLLVPKEYAKVAALLKLCRAYKEVIKEQAVLVNAQIAINNALKEYIALEKVKSEEYKNLWADSENAYRQERYLHTLDNKLNKALHGIMVIGIATICIIAL